MKIKIINPEKCDNYIFFKIFCTVKYGRKLAWVRFTIGPKSGNKIKYVLKCDPENYNFSEFSKKIYETPITKGSLNFFIINEETGKKELVSLDILSECPQNLSEDKILEIPAQMPGLYADLSEIMEKVGL